MRQPSSVVNRVIDDVILGRLDYYRFPDRRASWGGAFNGQFFRRRMFEEIIAATAPAAIVETGTYRGTTTKFLAEASGKPVFTVECLPRNYGFAKQNLQVVRNVTLTLGDSRSFLRRLIAEDRLPQGPIFFYLDAHWGEDLPIFEEIEVIFKHRPEAVVMIDDFQVPDDPGYGFDNYGVGKALTLSCLTRLTACFGLVHYFPNCPAEAESGMKRGCVVIAALCDVVETLDKLASLRRGGAKVRS